MRYFLILLILLNQIFIKVIAHENVTIDFTPLYYNVLELDKEQISQFDAGNKSILNKRQKSQYRIIKHLEKHEKRQRQKDYYKSNPRMSIFGDLKKK